MSATCRDCGQSWSGEKSGHCTVCHETFTTNANFDKHLVIERGPGVYKVVGHTPPAEVIGRHGERLLFWNEKRQAWSGPPTPIKWKVRQ